MINHPICSRAKPQDWPKAGQSERIANVSHGECISPFGSPIFERFITNKVTLRVIMIFRLAVGKFLQVPPHTK